MSFARKRQEDDTPRYLAGFVAVSTEYLNTEHLEKPIIFWWQILDITTCRYMSQGWLGSLEELLQGA